MKVIVSPTKSPIRGILAMPIDKPVMLDLTYAQIKRCIVSGGVVHKDAVQGNMVSAREQITLANIGSMFDDGVSSNRRLPLPIVDVPKTVHPADEGKKEVGQQQKQHLTKSERRRLRREAEEAAAAATEAASETIEDAVEDNKEKEE